MRATWLPLRDRYRSIADLRFIALLLALGTLLVCVVPQGRDVVATVSDSWADESPSTRMWWTFAAAVTFLGLQSWLWGRFLVQLRHRANSRWREDRLLVQLPRLFGVVPHVAAAISLFRVPDGHGTALQGLALLALGAVAYLFYWKRYALASRLVGWAAARRVFQDELPGWGLARFELWTLAVSLALSAASIAWLALDPVTLPSAIGPAALAFLALALMIPVVSLLIAAAWRERPPVLTGLLLVALAFSLTNGNHDVRTLPAGVTGPEPLADAYRRWAAQAPRDPADPASAPLVLVSAAGGASRAGLWTAAALDRLATLSPEFERSLFAISAVSGGALGAVAHLADLKAATGGASPSGLDARHASLDFLSPALGGMLYTDMVQRFLPLAVLRDRSWSIERGFERGWDRQCRADGMGSGCAGLMAGPLLDLWTGPARTWRPNLLLVGTLEEDGRRVITSNLDLVERQVPARAGAAPEARGPLLPDAYDFHHVTGRRVRASTAIMNSARFPWVSPAGLIRDPRGRPVGHMIDGGYFEASGAETSIDLARAIIQVAARLCAAGDVCVRPRPVFVTLLNAEAVDPVDMEADPCGPVQGLSPGGPPRRFANDALAPVRGMFSTQGSRAELALARLAREGGPADGVAAACGGVRREWARAVSSPPSPLGGASEIRLVPCRRKDQRELAMSWTLSAPTRQRLLEQVAGWRAPDAGPATSPRDTLSRCASAQQREVTRLLSILQGAGTGNVGPAVVLRGRPGDLVSGTSRPPSQRPEQ